MGPVVPFPDFLYRRFFFFIRFIVGVPEECLFWSLASLVCSSFSRSEPPRDTTYPVNLPIPPSISIVHVLHARLSHRSQWLALDLTGKYPVRSRLGHEYILISSYYLGYIYYTPQLSRTKYAYRDSFLSVCSFFSARHLPIA